MIIPNLNEIPDESLLASEEFLSSEGVKERIARNLCLEFYLHTELEQICTGNIQKNTNLLTLLEKIKYVYHALLSPLIYDVEQKSIILHCCQPLQQVSNNNL